MIDPLPIPTAATASSNPSLSTQRLRDQRQRLGISIGRKRLLAQCSPGTSSTNNSSASSNNDNRLLFRRGDDADNTIVASNNFLETPSPYVAVSFLNDDVVVAADARGRIDAVRLPSTRAGDDNSKGGGGRGNLVASRLGDPLPTMPDPRISLFSFNGGQTFAAGMPGGEVRIFSTEHDTSWTAADAKKRSNDAAAASSNSSKDLPFLHCSLRHGGPRRKYERMERGKYGKTLFEMLESQSPSHNYFPELLDWNSGQYRRTQFSACSDLTAWIPGTDAQFSFRELSGGSLLTAYVDPDLDCFSVRLMDGRMMSQESINAKCETQVCIDTKPLHMRGNWGKDEDITAMTFVGDHTLATAHVSLLGSKDAANLIKFWDMRMISISSSKPTTTAAVVASFPLNECNGVEACKEVCVSGSNHFDVSALIVNPPDGTQIPTSAFAVSRLTGSIHNGRLSIATQALEEGNIRLVVPFSFEEVLVDANRLSVLHKSQVTETSNGKQLTPAFTPTLDFMAAYHQEGQCGEADPSILLFDLSKLPATDGLSKKRTHEDMKGSSARTNGCLQGQIDASVKDSFGIESALECLALNDHGTALVCGSGDGDLFIWR